jgi:hypothetical protein
VDKVKKKRNKNFYVAHKNAYGAGKQNTREKGRETKIKGLNTFKKQKRGLHVLHKNQKWNQLTV